MGALARAFNITVGEAYEETCGVEGAIAEYLNEGYGGIDGASYLAFDQLIWAVFQRMKHQSGTVSRKLTMVNADCYQIEEIFRILFLAF